MHRLQNARQMRELVLLKKQKQKDWFSKSRKKSRKEGRLLARRTGTSPSSKAFWACQKMQPPPISNLLRNPQRNGENIWLKLAKFRRNFDC